MLTLSKEIATLRLGVVRGQQRHSRVYKQCTHLTIDRNFASGIQEDESKYHGPKGGNSRKGVNLSSIKGMISPGGRGDRDEAHIFTDPYRPAVRAASPNDTPLIIESGEVFPARP